MRFDDAAIQNILQGRRAIGRVSFPGDKDITIGVRLLSDRDIDMGRFEAQIYIEQYCKKVQLTPIDFINIDPELLERETKRHIIVRAFVDPDSPAERPTPFFSDIEQVRSLDSVLVAQLWDIYIDWQDVVNPRLSYTEEEVTALGEALKDERLATTVLATFDRDTLQSLVRFMASQLSISRSTKSSTSPP